MDSKIAFPFINKQCLLQTSTFENYVCCITVLCHPVWCSFLGRKDRTDVGILYKVWSAVDDVLQEGHIFFGLAEWKAGLLERKSFRYSIGKPS
jgi:hypothetical protein